MHIDMLSIEASPGPAAEQAPPEFFMTRFYDMNEEYIDELDTSGKVSSDLEQIVEDEKGRLGERLDDFGEDIGSKMADIMIRPLEASVREMERDLERTPEVWIFEHEEIEAPITMVLLGRSRGHRRRRRPPSRGTTCLLIADNRSQTSDFVSYFEEEVNNITNVAGNFVDLQRYDHGGEHVKNHLDQMKNEEYVEEWHIDETDDGFEQEVYDTVDELTAMSLPNVNLKLAHGENPEYDIICQPIGKIGSEYAIEVKNYDREEIEEVDDPLPDDLRYRLITQPKEEAERVNLNLITVVKGLSDEQYEDLQRHAEPSGVVLLNNENYKSRLREVLIEGGFDRLMKELY